jgi:uncharacterized protein
MVNGATTTTVGLISDTHFQDRCFELPQQLGTLWKDVDLILHAGDVGDLNVLDQLGQIAPVKAVHGNDEPRQAKQLLPSHQLISVAGSRILLWHSHYPDPVEEKAKRTGTWGPKLERIAACGREYGANFVIFGHTHVPMLVRYDEIVLINPGALASGSYFTRQAVASIGLLRIPDRGTYQFHHHDAASGQVVDLPAPNVLDEFHLLAGQYQTSIVPNDLQPNLHALARIAYEDSRAVAQAVIPLYRRCLQGETMLRRDLIDTIRSSPDLTPNDRAQVLSALTLEV